VTLCRPYEENGVTGVEVGSVTFDDLGVPAFIVNSASAAGLWAGAKSFTEGFRGFERTLADCRASGGDVFSAVQDVSGHAAQTSQGGGGWCARWHRRLRRVALIGITGTLVYRRLR
jgi:hypothetical protein